MNVNHAATARLVLTVKAVNVEQGRPMGRAASSRGPWTPERVAKMRATQAVLNAMSAEARRYYRVQRKSRWLTNVLRIDGDRKVFHLEGVDPLTGRRFAMHLEFDPDVTLSEFLVAITNCDAAPLTMRLDAAKNAAALTHSRPKAVVTIERSPRVRSSSVATKNLEATAAPTGSPEWRRRISEAVKRGLARKRPSPLVATDATDVAGSRDVVGRR